MSFSSLFKCFAEYALNSSWTSFCNAFWPSSCSFFSFLRFSNKKSSPVSASSPFVCSLRFSSIASRMSASSWACVSVWFFSVPKRPLYAFFKDSLFFCAPISSWQTLATFVSFRLCYYRTDSFTYFFLLLEDISLMYCFAYVARWRAAFPAADSGLRFHWLFSFIKLIFLFWRSLIFDSFVWVTAVFWHYSFLCNTVDRTEFLRSSSSCFTSNKLLAFFISSLALSTSFSSKSFYSLSFCFLALLNSCLLILSSSIFLYLNDDVSLSSPAFSRISVLFLESQVR